MNEVHNFIEIFLLRIVNFLIARQYRDITLTVTNSNSAAVKRPSQAIKWAIFVRDWLADDRYFTVRIDIPDIDEAFCVARSENTRMSWTPSRIIHVLLRTLERHEWLIARIRRPKFHSPVHGARKKQLCHFTMLLALADTWMNVHGSDWCIVVLACSLYGTSLPNIALIDVEVFRAHIEILLLTLREIQAVSVDLLPILTASYRTLSLLSRCTSIGGVFWYAQEVERLRIHKHGRPPIAHLSIVTDTHDRVLIMVSDD